MYEDNNRSINSYPDIITPYNYHIRNVTYTVAFYYKANNIKINMK